jgi:hypothetical protein
VPRRSAAGEVPIRAPSARVRCAWSK